MLSAAPSLSSDDAQHHRVMLSLLSFFFAVLFRGCIPSSLGRIRSRGSRRRLFKCSAARTSSNPLISHPFRALSCFFFNFRANVVSNHPRVCVRTLFVLPGCQRLHTRVRAEPLSFTQFLPCSDRKRFAVCGICSFWGKTFRERPLGKTLREDL